MALIATKNKMPASRRAWNISAKHASMITKGATSSGTQAPIFMACIVVFWTIKRALTYNSPTYPFRIQDLL